MIGKVLWTNFLGLNGGDCSKQREAETLLDLRDRFQIDVHALDDKSEAETNQKSHTRAYRQVHDGSRKAGPGGNVGVIHLLNRSGMQTGENAGFLQALLQSVIKKPIRLVVFK